MKKRLLSAVVAVLLTGCLIMAGCGSFQAEQTSAEASLESSDDVNVRVAALKGPTAMGMVKLMEDAANGATANKYDFTIAAAVDEITPKVVQGETDIAAVPANLASVLYNNTDKEVQVLAVNTLGVLYIVENGETINSVQDLKGRTIYASGKGATPEYALNYMLEANGIDAANDVTIEYKAEHSECVAALLNDPNGVAMLPQPFVTTAMAQNEGIRIALDLTKEWENVSGDNEKATLITGVVVARKAFVEEHPDAVMNFMKEYEASVDYANNNLEEASNLIEKYDIVKAAVAKKALPYCNITFIAGDEMEEALSSYLNILAKQNPKAVGGQVPDEGIYYKK